MPAPRIRAPARGPYAHFQILHAAFLRRAAGLLGSDLGGERGRLARALETSGAGSRPRQGVTLAVGNGDDGVVEGGVNVGDAFGHVLLDLFPDPGCRGSRCLCHVLNSLYSMRLLRHVYFGAAAGAAAALALRWLALRGPLRVRALVRVR